VFSLVTSTAAEVLWNSLILSALLRQLLHRIHPYGLSYSVLETHAEIRRSLRPPQGGGLIGDVDTLIEATARGRGLTLVTTDADFRHAPDLSLIVLDRRTWTEAD